MKKPEIILVELRNGDAAIFLNSEVVYALEAENTGPCAIVTANNIAEALGVEVLAVEMDVPADGDWNWGDVYELVPSVAAARDAVPVAHWNSKVYHEDMAEPDKGKPFVIEVADQRETHGQLFVDLASEDGNLDDMLSCTFEVNSLSGIDGDMPCMHLHFDGDNLAASFFKQGDRFIVRPESDVRIASTVLSTGEHVFVLE